MFNTRSDLKRSQEIAEIADPHCPIDQWWKLAREYPFRAKHSILFGLITLEYPERWKTFEDRMMEQWQRDIACELRPVDLFRLSVDLLRWALTQFVVEDDRSLLIHPTGEVSSYLQNAVEEGQKRLLGIDNEEKRSDLRWLFSKIYSQHDSLSSRNKLVKACEYLLADDTSSATGIWESVQAEVLKAAEVSRRVLVSNVSAWIVQRATVLFLEDRQRSQDACSESRREAIHTGRSGDALQS